MWVIWCSYDILKSGIVKQICFWQTEGHTLGFSWLNKVCCLGRCYARTISAKQNQGNLINTLRLRQNGWHFADDIFKCIFFSEEVWILIKISLKFVPKGPINKITALDQIMTWHHPGDKPLSEAMLVRLPIHICFARPQVDLACISSEAVEYSIKTSVP